jgi:hypothetical protein
MRTGQDFAGRRNVLHKALESGRKELLQIQAVSFGAVGRSVL